jgi:hypothetical protein
MEETYEVDCTYDPCNCTVTADVATGEAYCSEFCRDADGTIEAETCECSHPPCDEP